MATQTLKVSQGTDDAEQRESGANYDSAGVVASLGNGTPPTGRWIGLRFVLSAAIPAGSVINSAYISFPDIISAVQDDLNADVYAHDTASAATFSAGSGTDVVTRALTTASVNWSVTGLANDEQSPNLASVVQELVNSYSGLASGAGLAFILAHVGTTEWLRVNTYDNDPTDGADFALTYTPPQGGTLINGGLINGGLINGGLVA